MTPIKTLKEAKKEFEREYRYLFESEETGKFYPDALEKTWNWFESTLSSLTEQMIPEESPSAYEFDIPSSSFKKGYDTCREFVKAKRKELLK